MENEKIALLDTSVLIELYRKKDKTKSYFYKLSDSYASFVVSSITVFEIYTGIKSSEEQEIWDDIFLQTAIIPFDTHIAKLAAKINIGLKRHRKQIDKADLFIAATAISQQIPMATLNKKHFERIDDLQLLV